MKKNTLVSVNLKKIVLCTTIALSVALTGCASVEGYSPAQSANIESHAKSFPIPPEGYSGLYIIRKKTIFGSALKKNIYIDGQYIGESAPGTYFYRLVKPGTHTIQTESEFSENAMKADFSLKENVLLEQYIKVGVFVGGANLEQTTQEKAEKLIKDCTRAKDQDNKAKDLPTADYSEGKGSIPAPLTSVDADYLAFK